MFAKEFWIAAAHRAIRTGCQVFVATVGTSTVLSEIDWKYVASASAVAIILSFVTSIATGLPEVEE